MSYICKLKYGTNPTKNIGEINFNSVWPHIANVLSF
jgi:hypothetical protein